MLKNVTRSILISSLLSVGAFAYEASNVNVNWTGYKTEGKAAVSGTFDKVNLEIAKDDNFSKFLSSAKVSIDPYTINTKMKFRDNNISSTLFKIANVNEIKANVKKVMGDEAKGKLDVEINMNGVSKIVPMNYTVEASAIKAEGVIDILNFSMNESFAAFAAKCKPFHAGKTWSEVTVSFNLPFKK